MPDLHRSEIGERITLFEDDCRTVLTDLAALIEAGSVPPFDACITDPPYEISMMGHQWDGSGIAFDPELWSLVMRCLKPGAHLAAFSLPKQTDRLGAAIRAAGAAIGHAPEIRDRLLYAVSADERWRAFLATLSAAQLEAFLLAIEAMDPDEWAWVFGQGFPKSLDVAKAIDASQGHKRPVIGTAADFARDGAVRSTAGSHAKPHGRQGGHGYGDRWAAPVTFSATADAAKWDGWGTSLKPAFESIILARKPMSGTVAENVLEHGVGALNIGACMVPAPGGSPSQHRRSSADSDRWGGRPGEYGHTITNRTSWSTFTAPRAREAIGRHPANLLHDGSEAVLSAFANFGTDKGQSRRVECRKSDKFSTTYGEFHGSDAQFTPHDTPSSAARFFYAAKAGAQDRWGSRHPTVKPLDLMRYLVRMLTPPGGLVLDLFAGSGSTGVACQIEGMRAVLIERDPAFAADIRERCAHYAGLGRHSLASRNRHSPPIQPGDLPLFE